MSATVARPTSTRPTRSYTTLGTRRLRTSQAWAGQRRPYVSGAFGVDLPLLSPTIRDWGNVGSDGEVSEPSEAWQWHRRRPNGDELGTHAALARYVSAEAVRSLQLVTWRDEGERDTEVAARLYSLLRARAIGYALEPYLHKHGEQLIRDPWLLLKNEVGTCIDFATTYAAMCLEATIRPLLAVTDEHAFVVIAPEHMSGKPHPTAPLRVAGFTAAPGEREGVLCADSSAVREAIARGELVAIDCTLAKREGEGFTRAVEAGRSWAERTTLFIDLLYLQHQQGYGPLAPPAGHRPITQHVPADEDEFEEYPSHSALKEQLAAESGVVVLLGRQGQGKSRLARELARGRPSGGGWFLDAAGPQALISGLAAVDLAERGEGVAGRARADREGYAYNALALLAESQAPWIVVLDNADGDPGLIEHLLPEPREGQLVLITSTEDGWRRVPRARLVLELPPVPDAELDDPKIAPLLSLIDGRLLLKRAFMRLLAATGWNADAVARHAPEGEAEDTQRLRAQLTMWGALREAPEFGDMELYASVCAAFLPPDHQPLSAFGVLAGEGGEAAARYLADHGLLTYELQVDAAERSSLRLHRTFGEAIRIDMGSREPQLCDEICVRIAGEPSLRELLDVHGDLDLIDRLTERVERLDDAAQMDLALGLALHGAGTVLELQGQTRRSGEVFARAERHLNDGAHQVELARCRQGRARTANQHHQKDEPLLREAVDLAGSARELLEAEGRSGEHCRAMEGLLLEKLSAFPREGESEIELLKDALAVIEEADERRRNDSFIDHAELARSSFNRAGPRIRLAQKERPLAREHLDEALAIYTHVRKQREEIYRRPVHPHIAACVIGEAYVGYYRATLLGGDHQQRTRWLREATERSAEALRQRSWLEGSIDLDEVQKAASFMTKVLLARLSAPVAAASRHEEVYNGAMAELGQAGIALQRVPVLPAGTREEIRAAIQGWVDSPALRMVVGEFGGVVPASPLADQLTWLEEFSAAEWDFRAGKERNLADVPRLKPETEKVAFAAAEALGLIGADLPEGHRDDDSPARYEHVLILGGLVRACLARPLHAAKLLRDGVVQAGSVTALGGFRKIAGDEVGMVEEVTGEEVDDEFHAMDAGVRGAFGLAGPLSERGEDSDVLGASWRVREYSGDDVPVRVVAAPSMAPGERRANTPDTYEWFATQLAELRAGDRVLIVTTEIYVPYQHADALRMLALPYGVLVETVGVVPGKVHPALRQTFGPDKYLQELRSTIGAYHALHAAL